MTEKGTGGADQLLTQAEAQARFYQHVAMQIQAQQQLGGLYELGQTPQTVYGHPFNPADPAHQRALAQYYATLPRTTRNSGVAREGLRAGEIIGWRIWTYSGHTLESVFARTQWEPGKVVRGDIEDQGVHAWKTREQAAAYAGGCKQVLGTILMWGEIVEHEHGFRAEFAKVNSIDAILNGSFTSRFRVYKLRKLYGVGKFHQPDPTLRANEGGVEL